jgi:hypothetical protein
MKWPINYKSSVGKILAGEEMREAGVTAEQSHLRGRRKEDVRGCREDRAKLSMSKKRDLS